MKIRLIDLPLFILSVMLSVTLWFVVRLQQDNAKNNDNPQYLTMKVTVLNLPPNYVLDAPPPDVNYQLSGDQGDLQELTNRKDQLSATIDMSHPILGKHTYPIHFSIPEEFHVTLLTKSQSLALDVDQIVSQTVRVEVAETGVLPDGNFKYQGASVQPEQVLVEGKSRDLKKLSHIKAPLDLSVAQPNEPMFSTLNAVNESDNVLLLKMTPPRVTVIPHLVPAPPTRQFFISPIFKGQPAAGFRLKSYDMAPPSVALVAENGKNVVLANLKVLETKPIDLTGLKTTTLIPVELVMPAGVRLTKPQKFNVRVIIEPANSPGSPSGGVKIGPH